MPIPNSGKFLEITLFMTAGPSGAFRVGPALPLRSAGPAEPFPGANRKKFRLDFLASHTVLASVFSFAHFAGEEIVGALDTGKMCPLEPGSFTTWFQQAHFGTAK